MYRLFLTCAFLCTTASAALGTSTTWTTVEGGRVRLVTAGKPDADGTLRAALEIQLSPGWKTYWLDPGSAGVPPTFAVETAEGPFEVTIGFPPPQRFADESGEWAGYDQSVALPITLRLPGDASPTATASAFLGICETICIPVQAQWTFDLTGAHSTAADETIVAAAFASQPDAAEPGFGASISAITDDALLIATDVPDGAEIVDLFVAGTETVSLAAPVRLPDDTTMFRVPVLGLYGNQPWQSPLRYTLVTSAGVVSGTLATE